ncbi:YhcB family protein [Brumicola pallidula]|nr:YhcB family protein [Glaciecola pallidula]
MNSRSFELINPHFGDIMEIGTLITGIVIGSILGAIIGFIAVKNMRSNSENKVNHTEAELKALLAIQARQHLDISRQALTDIQNKTAALATHLNEYEESLAQATMTAADSKDSFFGEHASVFLRNSLKANKNDLALAQPDTQPRDFANSGSGVFVGVAAKAPKENKSEGQ